MKSSVNNGAATSSSKAGRQTAERLGMGRWVVGATLGATLSTVVAWGEVLPAAAAEPADLQQLAATKLCGGCDLSGANLAGADLRSSHLIGADLRGANLAGANLRSANLEGADLTGANLQGADLTGAWMTNADLSEAQLDRANLSAATLIDVQVRGASLNDLTLTGATISDTAIGIGGEEDSLPEQVLPRSSDLEPGAISIPVAPTP